MVFVADVQMRAIYLDTSEAAEETDYTKNLPKRPFIVHSILVGRSP